MGNSINDPKMGVNEVKERLKRRNKENVESDWRDLNGASSGSWELEHACLIHSNWLLG